MKPPDEVREELARQWLSKAQEDMDAARTLLSREPPILAAVGFHSQQAAEKSLKCALTWHQVEFPKTHDLAELLDLLARVDAKLAASLDGTIVLTEYGVEVRYPGDAPELSLDEAARAVDLADGVLEAAREIVGASA
jgi:HEPN domain-containing protein